MCHSFFGQLTVYYEAPYWVGIFERHDHGHYSVSRVVFGSEPKIYDIQNFVDEHYFELEYSKPKLETIKAKKLNPKRMQREISKLQSQRGVRTKAQEAIQENYAAHKVLKKKKQSQRKKEEAQLQFNLKQQKKKQKKKGH